MSAYLYMLRCADGWYYVGTTRGSLEQRIVEHDAGTFDGFTALRRPVTLVFSQDFELVEDAVSAERQVKGWRREKKEALIRGDFDALPVLSRRAAPLSVRPSRRLPARTPPQDEVKSLMGQKKLPHPEVPRAARPRRAHGARPSHRVPRDLLDPVVEYFHPQRVILFGSRARGEARRDSDIDLLVIVDDDTPPEKLTLKAGYEAHHSPHAADVFPMRAEDFERDRAIVNTLAAEADADGIVVYGPPKGPCMKTPTRGRNGARSKAGSAWRRRTAG